MKHHRYALISLVLLLIVTACGGSDEGAQTTTVHDTASTDVAKTAVQRQLPGSSSFFAINEVGLGPEGYIALTNFTNVPVSLVGLYLCQGRNCFELPDVAVGPGETARVALGDGAGLDGVVATEASLGELRPSDGEIALYVSQEFDDPAAMLVYLEWGSTPHDRTDIAIAAGLWLEGSYAPSSENATRLFRVEESGLWLFHEP